MRRRLIGGVMAAMLVIGLMPTSVWAEDPGVSVNAGDAVDFSDPDFQKLINNTLRRAEDTVITTAIWKVSNICPSAGFLLWKTLTASSMRSISRL